MKRFLLSRPDVLFGHMCMLALLALAVWFAEERALLIDSAYQLFYDINHESILINDHRLTMVLSQMLPWLLIKLHAPLRWVIVCYSAVFIVMAYGCYLLSVYLLGHRRAALLMLFALLGMRATFFHCLSETFQLMFFAPLLYALVCSDRRGWWRWALLLLTEAAAFFVHPIAPFFILFIAGFLMLERRRVRLEAPVAVLLVWMGVLFFVKTRLGSSGHDQSFVPTGETLQYALTHFFRLNSIGFFYAHFVELYLFPTLLWVLTLVGYVRGRRWLKLLFVGLFVPAFFAMSVVVYWQGDGPIGMERTYLPLFFFTGLAFFEDELPRWALWPRRAFGLLLAVLLTVSVVRIGREARPYANRLEEVGRIAAQARAEGQRKLLVTRSVAEQVFPVNIWGLALESMLYTARDGADQTVTIYMEEDGFDHTDPLYADTEAYAAVNWWKRWSVEALNYRYFRLPSQGYKLLVVGEDGYSFVDL